MTMRSSICLIYLAAPFVLLGVLLKIFQRKDDSSTGSTILVGVVSGRNRFAQRDAVRRTWLTLGSDAVTLKFLVGRLTCPIPLMDRAQLQMCVAYPPLDYHLPEGTNGKTIFRTAHECSFGGDIDGGKIGIGFSFTVVGEGGVVVNLIGVLNGGLPPAALRPARASLADSRGGQILATASFIHDPNLSNSAFVWKAISFPVELAVGFEGEVRVTGLTSVNWSSFLSIEVTTPAIVLLELLQPDGTWVPRIAAPTDSRFRPAVAISYTLSDAGSLQKFLEGRVARLEAWQREVDKTELRLSDEVRRHGDIVFLDVVDVYSNLSRKVQQFFDWALNDGNGNWSYLLKTDDDTFVDLKRVVASFSTTHMQSAQQHWNVWSCIKKGVRVPRCCKWRDWLPEKMYPGFPAGGGYLLPRTVVKALAFSGIERHLNRGEDVRLGLLLWELPEGLRPRLGGTCLWTCSSTDAIKALNNPACNLQDLSPRMMFQTWWYYNTLCRQRICHPSVWTYS